jgi:hypothetical protein
MTMKKKHLMGLATVAILTGSIFSATRVSAQNDLTQNTPMSSLVQKLADKFGLSRDEVQAVFDEEHASREAERETRYHEKLTQLVSDGKITEDQKKLILAKHNEMMERHQSDRDSLDSSTLQERKTKMQEERAALEDWAKTNNIDVQYLMGMWGGKGHGRHMKMDLPRSN